MNSHETSQQPLVTVVCITYGHEHCIAQALDSFLSQETSFRFQIFVGEDHGPDNTAEIVLGYAARHPDVVFPFIREQNMGAQRNLIDLCNRAGTPYIAFCEGDDYWTDTHKLQKQFDLMEQHPEYRACVHATEILCDVDWYLKDDYRIEDGEPIVLPYSKWGFSEDDVTDGAITMRNYLKSTPFHTSSYFYRWNYDLKIPEWYYDHFAGDHSLMMLQVGDGLCGVIPEAMSVYRRSEVGVYFYQNKTEHYYKTGLAWALLLMDLRDYFDVVYGPALCGSVFKDRIKSAFYTFLRMSLRLGRLGEFIGKDDDVRLSARKIELLESFVADADKNNNVLKSLWRLYGESGVRLLVSNDESVSAAVSSALDEAKQRRRNRSTKRVRGYVDYASVKKDPYIWIFSIDGYQAYSNNTRHLFEHVVTYHPELRPYWITKNQKYLHMAEAENMPILKIGSRQCVEIMKSAAVGFVCLSKTRSLRVKGFNAEMKIVRLWGGPYLHDFTKDRRYASNLESPQGSAQAIVSDNFDKYGDIELNELNEKYFVEAYEDTLLSLAVNRAIAKIQHEFFHIPEDRIFLCGNPRSYPIYDRQEFVEKRVLYSPKYRSSEVETKLMVHQLVENLETIDQRMQTMGAVLDLHLSKPIMNREPVLMGRVEQCKNVSVLHTNDSFTDLPQYDVLISDYNESMFDYALHDKPIVILNPGKQLYLASTPLLCDYDACVPGCQLDNWDDALDAVEERLADPACDMLARQRALKSMFEMEVVDENNSERIVQEVKRRLGI